MLDWLRSTFGIGARPLAKPLYDAIVTEARLPDRYRQLGIPDTLEGRYEMLVIHLFAVLRTLRKRPQSGDLMQSLTDQFTDDMDAVLRELGVGDTSVPRRVRKLAVDFMDRQNAYETALQEGGGERLAGAAGRVLPLAGPAAELAGQKLANHLEAMLSWLETQPTERLAAGDVRFPPALPEGEDER